MSPVSTTPSSLRLQDDVLRTILYFDIFHHPLRVDEIYRFLPSNSTSQAEIAAACRDLSGRTVLSEKDGFYFLAARGGDEDPVSDRLVKESRARWYWSIARALTLIISRFPFVRGVFVSGELSKGVASKDGDIDFFIVTADRRLWIARSLLIAFKKLVLFNQKKFLCLNHFIAESALAVESRNIYTAYEIATLAPLYNSDLFHAYLQHNSWVCDLLPNAKAHAGNSAAPRGRRSLIQRFFELPFLGFWGDALERRLMQFWKSTWDKRYRHIPAEKRSALFQCSPSLSTAYAGDFLSKVLDQYRLRLAAHGLEANGVVAV